MTVNQLPNNHNPPSPNVSPTNSPFHHKPPSVISSFKSLLLGSWFNLLLLAVPFSFLSHFLHWGSTPDFIISFIAIIPLAALLGNATEQVALKLGQTLGGLLNATFGNAVEAIVGILALLNNELRIVQTSLIGSILSNLLLVLGCSFFAAGFNLKESHFQATAAQASTSIMTLATATLILPAAFHASRGTTDDTQDLLFISRGTAVVLLLMYLSYLYFQLHSHAYLFETETAEEEGEEPYMNVYSAVTALLIITLITSFCADYLVGSIDEFATKNGIPKTFIGLILLPIVGNASEHWTSVLMAFKGKMELTIGVSVGSSIQIAVGVIPILVLVAWPLNRDLTLYFQTNETVSVFVAVILSNLLLQDGKANWLEGILLMALYTVIALIAWVS